MRRGLWGTVRVVSASLSGQIAALLAGITGRLAAIAGIFLATVVLRTLVHRIISRSVERAAERVPLLGGEGASLRAARHAQRLRSLGGVLRGASTALLVGIALLSAGSVLGVHLAPLLAGAGVVGVALAFGAQSLVRDVLSGLFLLAEDQFGVGDRIDVSTVSGVVEEVGLRITTLRDDAGAVWYLRNGELLRVGNLSQGPRRFAVELTVSRAGARHVAAICTRAEEALEGARSLGLTSWRCTAPRLWAVSAEHSVYRTTLEHTGGDVDAVREAWMLALLEAGRRRRVGLSLSPV